MTGSSPPSAPSWRSGLLLYGNVHSLGAVAIALATTTLLISVGRMALPFAQNLPWPRSTRVRP